jgi:hypothetical protein
MDGKQSSDALPMGVSNLRSDLGYHSDLQNGVLIMSKEDRSGLDLMSGTGAIGHKLGRRRQDSPPLMLSSPPEGRGYGAGKYQKLAARTCDIISSVH